MARVVQSKLNQWRTLVRQPKFLFGWPTWSVLRVVRQAALYLSIAMSPIGVANAGTPRQIYESCIAAVTEKYKDTCWRLDLMERTILFECTPQLLALLRSMPPVA